MMIDTQKLDKTMEIIDKIAESSDNKEISELEVMLREITGKKELSAQECREYWSWTSLEELAIAFLSPIPEKSNLSNEQLAEIIEKIFKCEYSESECDYQFKVLKAETGLSNITDYIYYPNLVGLNADASMEEIISKILADRKNN